jgi:hypothetical protein
MMSVLVAYTVTRVTVTTTDVNGVMLPTRSMCTTPADTLIMTFPKMKIPLPIDGSGVKLSKRSKNVSHFARKTVLTYQVHRPITALLSPLPGTCHHSDVAQMSIV